MLSGIRYLTPRVNTLQCCITRRASFQIIIKRLTAVPLREKWCEFLSEKIKTINTLSDLQQNNSSAVQLRIIDGPERCLDVSTTACISCDEHPRATVSSVASASIKDLRTSPYVISILYKSALLGSYANLVGVNNAC